MSNLVFPDYPGITIDIQRQPEWHTMTKEALSGVETTVSYRPWPRWRYTLKIDVLRASEAEIAGLEGFFNRHAGAFEDFLFLDPENSSVADQPFGICDGTTTVFQLSRAVGDWVEPVWAPALSPAPVLKRNGVALTPITDYSHGSNGLVQLNTAFASGQLTWSGNYYMRVRFTDDKLSLQRILLGLWKVGKVELISKVYPT